MSHKHSNFQKPQFRTREAGPSMQRTPQGAIILCPFCKPPHPLVPGEASTCGTILKLTAVQDILPSRVARFQHIKCLKCHQEGDGDMVQYMNGFIHLQDCDPKTRFLPAPPQFSLPARIVNSLPKSIRARIEATTGTVQQVREIDRDGIETGKILGYFFMKSGSVPNG